MTERSWYWGGVSTGDAGLPAPYGAPYSDDMFSDIFSYLFTRDRATQGVVATLHPSYSSNFDETHTGGTITVGTGIGMVDGKIYATDASIQFSPASDGDWCVILRKSWGSQTVRMLCVAYGTTVQTDGVTWDVELYRVTRSGGNITVVQDLRGWVLRPKTKVIPLNYIAYGTSSGNPKQIWQNAASGEDIYVQFVVPPDYQTDLEIWWTATAGNTNTGTITYSASVIHYWYAYGASDPRLGNYTYGASTSRTINVNSNGTSVYYAYKLYDHTGTDDESYLLRGRGLPVSVIFHNTITGTYNSWLAGESMFAIYKGG